MNFSTEKKYERIKERNWPFRDFETGSGQSKLIGRPHSNATVTVWRFSQKKVVTEVLRQLWNFIHLMTFKSKILSKKAESQLCCISKGIFGHLGASTKNCMIFFENRFANWKYFLNEVHEFLAPPPKSTLEKHRDSIFYDFVAPPPKSVFQEIYIFFKWPGRPHGSFFAQKSQQNKKL